MGKSSEIIWLKVSHRITFGLVINFDKEGEGLSHVGLLNFYKIFLISSIPPLER